MYTFSYPHILRSTAAETTHRIVFAEKKHITIHILLLYHSKFLYDTCIIDDKLVAYYDNNVENNVEKIFAFCNLTWHTQFPPCARPKLFVAITFFFFFFFYFTQQRASAQHTKHTWWYRMTALPFSHVSDLLYGDGGGAAAAVKCLWRKAIGRK